MICLIEHINVTNVKQRQVDNVVLPIESSQNGVQCYLTIKHVFIITQTNQTSTPDTPSISEDNQSFLKEISCIK